MQGELNFGQEFRSKQKSQLALQIINEHFGDITQDVAAALLNSELPTLAHLVRHFMALAPDKRLTSTQVREALLVLNQHNCLGVELPPQANVEGDTLAIAVDRLKQKGLIYELNVDMALNRIRFPKLLKLCEALFGPTGVIVMEELIDGGRLSPAQIRYRAATRLAELYEQECVSLGVSADKTIAEHEMEVQGVLLLMIRRRLIISLAPTDFKKKIEERKARADKILAYVSGSSASTGEPKSTKPAETSVIAPASAAVTDSSSNGNGGSSTATTVLAVKRKRRIIEDDEPDSGYALPLELRMSMGKTAGDSPAASASSSAIAGAVASSQGVGGGVRGGRGTTGRGAGRTAGRGRGRGRILALANGVASTSPEFDAIADISTVAPSSSSDSSSFQDGPREDSLWIIGWEQFIREQRHAACVQFVTERNESLAGKVVQVMLDASLPMELGPTEMNSHKISLTRIHELLHQTGTSSVSMIDIATLQKLLELLRTDTLEVVSKIHRSEMEMGGPYYQVNIGVVIAALQAKIVHSIAVERYGVPSGRIMQVLMQKRNLEQQVISDMIIIPAKETRERLYRLYKDEWIVCHEISKRPDFNPAASTYFWKIDHEKLVQAILNHLYITLFNIRVRRIFQFEDNKHLLAMTPMNTEESTQVDQLSRSLDRLDNAMIVVDHTLMYLHAFASKKL